MKYSFNEYCQKINEAKDDKEVKNPEHTDIKQFISAIKHSVWTNETVKLGGAIFTKNEMRNILKEIKDKFE